MVQQQLNSKAPVIYLAGGFYANDWQTKVTATIQGATDDNGLRLPAKFINPKTKERFADTSWKEEAKNVFSNGQYVAWDLHGIDQSDIVFIYIDKENTGLVGVLVELGYAKGRGKHVIVVIEEDHTFIKDRYFEFARKTADVSFSTLDEGVYYLNTLLTQYL